ncbi:MAG: helix-turn-helix domain-containing protein [Candidatus Caccovivens sp.]
MATFGQRLKELRLENKLTQIELAKELHLDKSTIAKYETDKIEPSLSIINICADFFQTSTDYILGRID